MMTDLDRLKEARSHLRALINTTKPEGPASGYRKALLDVRVVAAECLSVVSEEIGDGL